MAGIRKRSHQRNTTEKPEEVSTQVISGTR
jgi:hypothetical protein